MLWGVIGLLVFVILAVVLLYNRLVKLRQFTNNGWSDIEVQLKRRADLIPQIVKTVKAYAKHEKSLFAEITDKRTAALAAGDNIEKRADAESALQRPMTRLLAVAEDYPELKANQNFLDLQNELSDTEDKIEMARRFYNGTVRALNTAVETFPSNLIAGMFGFVKRAYFEMSPSDAALPDVSFGET